MIEMKSEILSRQFVVPSNPTPPHLKTFKLSLLDQLAPSIHGNMTFFFPSNSSTDFSTKSKLLQQSLAKTLNLIYPLAGRLQDAATIDCNDEGACFVEAQLNFTLSDVLNPPDFDLMGDFLPTSDHETVTMSNGSMLLVKFTSFTCGGVAMSLSLTHKFADLSSLVTLLQTWTKFSRGDNEPVVPDLFLGGHLLPHKPDLPNMSASINIKAEKFLMKRFVFSAKKLAELKARVDPEFKQVMHCHASRVEMVIALIWKCTVAAKQKNMGEFKPSAMFQAVNLRRRMSPPLPETAMGNFVWPFMVVVEEEKDMELVQLAIQMRKSFNEFCNNDANKFQGEDGMTKILEKLKKRGDFFKKIGDMSVYKCSSWCKFPLYDTDFGWGKALWHVSINKIMSNTIALNDTRSPNEVEVILTLDEEEMRIIETNQELLDYATINPGIN